MPTNRTPRTPPRRPGQISDLARSLFRKASRCCEDDERFGELYMALHRELGLKIWACSPLDVHRATPPPDEESPARGWREAWALRKELRAS